MRKLVLIPALLALSLFWLSNAASPQAHGQIPANSASARGDSPPAWARNVWQSVSLAEMSQNPPSLICATLDFALAAAFLILWNSARDFRVFRSMGIYLALFGSVLLWSYFGGQPSRWAVSDITAQVLVIIAGEAMRVRNRRWTWLLWPFCIAVVVVGWFPACAFLRSWPFEVTQLALGALIVQAFATGDPRDRRIARVFALLFLVRWTTSPTLGHFAPHLNGIQIAGWRWSYNSVSMILLGAATLVIYVRDLMADRAEKQRLTAELAAARAVQQMLIASEPPTLPGFEIRAVYKPFGEVGGDFFVIIPLSGAGVLAAIGDVSGKGLPAAMTVALLIGALESLAKTETSPGALLNSLNERALGRTCGGFTTCLILRVDARGTLTAANAGHLAPYCDGQELKLESSLPLGIAPGFQSSEATLRIAPGQRLTLLTDGVVEARNPYGELFGFERTAAICTQSAEAIADAAQAHGQEDDITVLTLTFVPQLVEAPAAMTHLSRSSDQEVTW